MSRQDDINLETWARNASDFGVDGWLDPAEPAALLHVADEMRGQRVLDLGVGAGRTTAMLRLLTDDYLGIDYTPEMVELARQRRPEARISLGDVRDLADQPTASVALVVFSNNGMDAVSHADRQRGLQEISRVLRPGGLLLLTVLNKDGPLYGCRPGSDPDLPWRTNLVQGRLDSAQPPEAAQPASDAGPLARVVHNWRALATLSEDHGDWGIAPLPAYEFGLLTHFCTLGAARDELASYGLRTERVWGCESPLPLDEDCRTCPSWYFYLAARRAE